MTGKSLLCLSNALLCVPVLAHLMLLRSWCVYICVRVCVLPQAAVTVPFLHFAYLCACVRVFSDSESPFVNKLDGNAQCHKQGTYNRSVRMGH